MDYRNGVPIHHLEFRNGCEVEQWLNCESPDTYPYRRRPTCERIALALKVLDIVEDEATDFEPHPLESSASELVCYDLLKEARGRLRG